MENDICVKEVFGLGAICWPLWLLRNKCPPRENWTTTSWCIFIYFFFCVFAATEEASTGDGPTDWWCLKCMTNSKNVCSRDGASRISLCPCRNQHKSGSLFKSPGCSLLNILRYQNVWTWSSLTCSRHVRTALEANLDSFFCIRRTDN